MNTRPVAAGNLGAQWLTITSPPSLLRRRGRPPVELCLPDMQLTLMADRGVFSGSRVDPGTLALLKESPHPPAAGDLLDLGCGYGPIACALARRSPGATVWAVDVNSRALELTAGERGVARDAQPESSRP